VRAPVRFAFGEPHGLLSITPSSQPRKVIGKHVTNLLPTFSEIAWGAARKSGFVFLPPQQNLWVHGGSGSRPSV
jgi:hypothetical protein